MQAKDKIQTMHLKNLGQNLHKLSLNQTLNGNKNRNFTSKTMQNLYKHGSNFFCLVWNGSSFLILDASLALYFKDTRPRMCLLTTLSIVGNISYHPDLLAVFYVNSTIRGE